jgi:hypothetical protein
MPSVDIAERDGNIAVKAELPGMNAKDIDNDVSGDVLTLRGEKKTEEEKKEERYFGGSGITVPSSVRSGYRPGYRATRWMPSPRTAFSPATYPNPKRANRRRLALKRPDHVLRSLLSPGCQKNNREEEKDGPNR